MFGDVIKRYRGGARVASGKYWNLYSGDYVAFDEGGGMLPAVEGEYVRAHPLLILAVGPLIGLAYLLFLPIAVPVMLAQFAGRKMQRAVAVVGRIAGGR